MDTTPTVCGNAAGRPSTRSCEAGVCTPVEHPSVQILVVVANIQLGTIEGQSGEGFLINSRCIRVSRS